ncbi:1815_t:CDS:1, partial [Funneliformis caledonium]
NDLSLTYVKKPLTTVLPEETSTIEVDPIKESSSNNLDKGKSPEIISSTSTTSETIALKPTISVDESFDASENILDTSTIGFDAPST